MNQAIYWRCWKWKKSSVALFSRDTSNFLFWVKPSFPALQSICFATCSHTSTVLEQQSWASKGLKYLYNKSEPGGKDCVPGKKRFVFGFRPSISRLGVVSRDTVMIFMCFHFICQRMFSFVCIFFTHPFPVSCNLSRVLLQVQVSHLLAVFFMCPMGIYFLNVQMQTEHTRILFSDIRFLFYFCFSPLHVT